MIVTLAEAKEYLRVDDNTEDATVEMLLKSAQALCEDVARLDTETFESAGDVLNAVEFERCRVWANVYALTARNADSAPERANKINYRVTIRYREGILPDDEIVWRSRRLKLISPPYNLDGKRIFTAFDCEEVVADGAT